MKLRKFEELVNYAVSGNMKQEEVSTIVVKLKNEKASIMSKLYAMPDSNERRQCFKELHSLMYRLYQAVVFVREEKDSKTGEVEKIYRKAEIIANMVLCYDVPKSNVAIIPLEDVSVEPEDETDESTEVSIAESVDTDSVSNEDSTSEDEEDTDTSINADADSKESVSVEETIVDVA